MSAALVQAEGLGRQYQLPRERLLAAGAVVEALVDVSFALRAGSTLGIVGESGSGKSTLARLVMALEAPSAGRVLFAGRDLHALPPESLRAARRDFQMVFQDPFSSLDPRMTIGRTVAEPLEGLDRVNRAERRERAAAMLDAVGLNAAQDLDKVPHEFSGGQRQRIAIARALVTHPKLIVADEPVSALDVSVQAQVLNLMQDLQQRFGLAYLFISHDLAVVERMADELLVLQAGRVVERGLPADVLRAPAHPYTQRLLAALPRPLWQHSR
ncbi:MAG: ATP-binding cassette domain-containing protein [Pseudomonadota bacterium]